MGGRDLLGDQRGQLARIAAGSDLIACAVEHGARGVDGEPVRRRREQRVAQELVDRREIRELHAESVGTSSRKSATSEPAA